MRTATLVLLLTTAASAREPVRFNRDVRPILAEHCWTCHGPDAGSREANLRLDNFDEATQPAESGQVAIMPFDPAASELVHRITAADPSVRMPPYDFDKPLSPHQSDTLQRWISEGAAFQKHWAFEPIVKPHMPEVSEPRTDQTAQQTDENPIDAFIAATLSQNGLTFSREAPREVLLRRVTLDLTGLPPTLDDLDRTEEPYEQVVERLLNSPHYGERMAVDWLDAARYADTNGYFSDKPRQMWLWRDWVIHAFNDDMPFDQFTIEQLAGDLLPSPTIQQRIATGFNRNHVANNETGIIDEEFRTEYVVDRVDTTMTTWLGLTAGCAQCHDHKYDPISQREFYQLFSFFNNVPETGLIVTDNPPPLLKVSTPEQDAQFIELAATTADASKKFEPIRNQLTSEITDWETDASQTVPAPPVDAIVLHESFDAGVSDGTILRGTSLTTQPGIRGHAAMFDATQHAERSLPRFDPDAAWTIGFWVLPDGSLSCPVSKIEPMGDRRGLEILWRKGRVSVNLVARWGIEAIELTTSTAVTAGQWHHVVVTCDGSKTASGVRIFLDGTPANATMERDSLRGSIRNDLPLLIGRRDSGLGYYGLMDEFRILRKSLSDKDVNDWFHGDRIRGILAQPAATRSSRDADVLLDYYIARHSNETARIARSELLRASQAEIEFRASIPTTLVMEEMPEPRPTHVLIRGQYDQPDEPVHPGVPTEIGEWPEVAPKNRLGLAQWLMAKQNPLTARVAVNRLWSQCFGEGLVRTPNDFGTQGEPPTHPELLNWLAATYQENGWNTKSILRLIVTSRTYRQSSSHRPDAATDPDPQNRLLSRGPAYRMTAEMIRDQALAASGLLRPQIGGPSVKPYQPPGLWEEVSYNAEDTYQEDTGDGLWRRSVYTYLKRQTPPPSFLAFDGTSREKCTVQRARTSTPLQALILLNDPTYTEAARALASVVLQSGVEGDESNDDERLSQMFRRVLCRTPDAVEVRTLMDLLSRQCERFREKPETALQLLNIGASKRPALQNPCELAAWTVVAHTILNLEEAITRR